MTSERYDVCLVSMPYASLQRPSLALGILKSILTRDGIPTTTAYANLWFAETVGTVYESGMASVPIEFLVGEWTFAAAAFPDRPQDRDAEYLDRVLEYIAHPDTSRGTPLAGSEAGRELIDDLYTLRAAATEFVDKTARRVLATGARVVGCTSTFEQHVASLALLRRVHELDPDVITMLGGANCETTMGEATHRCFPWVDYVVSGEAEGLITDLCRLVLTHGRDVEAGRLPRGVLGPAHRVPSGRRPMRLARALFRDLDSIPTPQYDDYFASLAVSPLRESVRPGILLETSRGCWWGDIHQCTFCGLNGSSMAFRSKAPDRVLADVHELEERHGVEDFEVVDNILDTGYFKTVLPSLTAEDRRRRFFYEVKANLSRAQIEQLVAAGIIWVQPGIESLHTEVLRLMDKGIRGWQNVQLLKWARELGLRLSWSVLWGFPGERDEYYQQMARWIPFLEHLQAPASLTHLRYDRYSVYHQKASELGLVLFPVRSMAYVYPLAPADLHDLTYVFTTEPGTGPLDVSVGSRGDMTTRRPGVLAVHEAMNRWQRAFGDRRRPVLAMTDADGVLRILDTRSLARAPRVTLTGVDRATYLACEAAPRAGRVADSVRNGRDGEAGIADASDDQVAAAVERLVAAALVLPIDDRLVALAVRGAIPAPPGNDEFPGGSIDRRLLGRLVPAPGTDARVPA